MEARVVVSGQGGVVDGGPRQFLPQQHRHSQPQPQPPLHQQAQISTMHHLLAGGISGAFSKTCTAPLARLTILFQIQGMHSDVAVLSKPCIWNEAVRIAKEEGFRAFWKGNLVTIAHRLPYSAVNFYSYDNYKIILKSSLGVDNNGGNSIKSGLVHFISGGMSGITAAAATYPLDLVRTRLAAQTNTIYYQGMGHALRTICRDEGILGLYKGLGATLLGVGPTIAISFSVYESLKTYWQTQRPDDSMKMVSLACGGLSGIASSTATFPLDLVRRRMQLEGAGGRARVYETGLFGTFKSIFRSEGLRGLYRGIMPEYYKVVPGIGIAFMTYETLKDLMSHKP